jgi:hypothetical protein
MRNMLPVLSRTLFGLALLTSACHRPSTSPTPLSTAECIDPAKVNPSGICTMEYNPVCGCNGQTYANPCAATTAGLRTFTMGPCPPKP